ncbi:MAG TPA: HD domain-containing protein [Acidobacteriaceae bacterium]|nr:HD domain-containing protein [Acidobacteriaceae bacterium]
MNEKKHTRQQAWELLHEYTQSISLLKHALGVETCMRAYGEAEAARRALSGREAEEFVETYAITGLLHDFDYEKYPSAEQHPFTGNRILTEQGWPEEIREAILGHAEYSGVPRVSHLARTLFACDELAGFLTAVSLVKPGKSIREVEVSSVRRKMKDKAFARTVHRKDIVQGAEELGVDLDAHIAFCIQAMQRNAEALGLDGSAAG